MAIGAAVLKGRAGMMTNESSPVTPVPSASQVQPCLRKCYPAGVHGPQWGAGKTHVLGTATSPLWPEVQSTELVQFQVTATGPGIQRWSHWGRLSGTAQA